MNDSILGILAEPLTFESLTGKLLVYAYDPWVRKVKLYFSPDGGTFFELKIRSVSGNKDKHSLLVDDPWGELTLELLVRDGPEIHFRGEYYWRMQPTINLDEVTVVPLET